MEYVLCSVFDRQARQYSAPFTSYTQETATRDFARAVRDSRNSPDKFPADFELHYCGRWNSDTGCFDSLANPQLLAKGADYLLEE